MNAPRTLIADDADEGAGLYGPALVPEKDTRSKLLRSKERYPGQVINVCRTAGFGCSDADLDEQFYCKHLVGFTDPDDPETFYPVKERLGTTQDGKLSRNKRLRYTDGDDPQPVLPTDKKVRVSTCFRVYRSLESQRAERLRQREEELTRPKIAVPDDETDDLL